MDSRLNLAVIESHESDLAAHRRRRPARSGAGPTTGAPPGASQARRRALHPHGRARLASDLALTAAQTLELPAMTSGSPASIQAGA